MNRVTVRLDLTGLKCPLPVLKTRQVLSRLHEGQLVEIFCTDPMAAIDIPHMVAQTGDYVQDIKTEGDRLTFLIERRVK